MDRKHINLSEFVNVFVEPS